MQIQQIPNTINYRSNLTTPKYTSFTGITPAVVGTAAEMPKAKFFAPVKKFFAPVTNTWKKHMDKMEEGMAHGFAKLIETKIVENAIKKIKNSKNLVAHLSAFTGVVLSGFYMKKTLENKQLDSKKKKTLAINQGSVCLLSTIGAYSLNKVADKKINKFIDKFMATNIDKDIKELVTYKKGIKSASSMMIFGMMYRFISPVLVTPIANHIGNTMQKNEDKLAKANEANK